MVDIAQELAADHDGRRDQRMEIILVTVCITQTHDPNHFCPSHMRKLVRAYPFAVVAVLISLTGLVGCVTGRTWEQQYALCQQQIKDREYDTARDICHELLTISARNRDTTQQAMAVSAQERLRTMYSSTDALRHLIAKAQTQVPPPSGAELGQLHALLGFAIYREKGSLPDAEDQLRQALELYRAQGLHGDEVVVATEKLNRVLTDQGKYEEAFMLLLEVSGQPFSKKWQWHQILADEFETAYLAATATPPPSAEERKRWLVRRWHALAEGVAQNEAIEVDLPSKGFLLKCRRPAYSPAATQVQEGRTVSVIFKLDGDGLGSGASVDRSSGNLELDRRTAASFSRIQCMPLAGQIPQAPMRAIQPYGPAKP